MKCSACSENKCQGKYKNRQECLGVKEKVKCSCACLQSFAESTIQKAASITVGAATVAGGVTLNVMTAGMFSMVGGNTLIKAGTTMMINPIQKSIAHEQMTLLGVGKEAFIDGTLEALGPLSAGAESLISGSSDIIQSGFRFVADSEAIAMAASLASKIKFKSKFDIMEEESLEFASLMFMDEDEKKEYMEKKKKTALQSLKRKLTIRKKSKRVVDSEDEILSSIALLFKEEKPKKAKKVKKENQDESEDEVLTSIAYLFVEPKVKRAKSFHFSFTDKLKHNKTVKSEDDDEYLTSIASLFVEVKVKRAKTFNFSITDKLKSSKDSKVHDDDEVLMSIALLFIEPEIKVSKASKLKEKLKSTKKEKQADDDEILKSVAALFKEEEKAYKKKEKLFQKTEEKSQKKSDGLSRSSSFFKRNKETTKVVAKSNEKEDLHEGDENHEVLDKNQEPEEINGSEQNFEEPKVISTKKEEKPAAVEKSDVKTSIKKSILGFKLSKKSSKNQKSEEKSSKTVAIKATDAQEKNEPIDEAAEDLVSNAGQNIEVDDSISNSVGDKSIENTTELQQSNETEGIDEDSPQNDDSASSADESVETEAIEAQENNETDDNSASSDDEIIETASE